MTEKAPRRAAVRRMATSQRWAIGVLGGAMELAGIVAVFLSDNQLGSVALILVGAGLLLLSTVGLLPMRVSYKDAEFVIAEILDDVVEEAGPAVAERVLESATGVLPGEMVQEARSRVRSAVEYQRAVLDAIQRTGTGVARFDISEPRVDGIPVDVVATRGNQVAFIEVKSGGGTRHGILKRAAELAQRARRLRGRWLLVTDTPITIGTIDRLAEDNIASVVWRDRRDDDALRHAIRSLFTDQKGRA